MSILNLTQHAATPEQIKSGVVEPENKAAIQAALTFDTIPSKEVINARAVFLAGIAKDSGITAAMIGGAPFFMPALERELLAEGITPCYAFSARVSAESIDVEGNVVKTNVFKHIGFVGVSS